MIETVIQRGWPVALLVFLSVLLLSTGNLSRVFGLGYWSYDLYQYWTFFLGATTLGVLTYIWIPKTKFAVLAMLSVIFGTATFKAEYYLWSSYLFPLERSQLFLTVGLCLLTAAVAALIAIALLRSSRLVLLISVAISLSLAPATYSRAKLAMFEATSNNPLVPTPGTARHVP